MKSNIIIPGLLMLLLGFAMQSCDEYERTGVTHEIYVDESELSLFAGDERQLTVSPEGTAVKWSSEDESIATVDNGLVKAVKAGTTNIEATADGSTFKVKVTVINKVVLTNVLLSDTVLNLTPGQSVTISATVVPEGANDVPITDFSWWSDDETVVRVLQSGKVYALEKEGATTIHYRRGTIQKDIPVSVSYTQPFNGPHILKKGEPCIIKFIDFDYGGPDVAWHDSSSGNNGNSPYRSNHGDNNANDVDVEGGRNIGWTADGEWLLYTIDVVDAGTYQVDLSVSGNGGRAHFELDGKAATSVFSVTPTGNWGNYQYNTKTSITVPKGRHKLKFYMDQAAYNLLEMKFTYKE
ncbi:MAG: Ig-like domain-containing protein [Prevotella sp.]|nr:Ig-like domain-containing protein [Prevotella sp.]